MRTEHLPSPSSPADAVLGFFAHHVVASDVDPDFVRHWVQRHPFAGSDVRFLTELAARLDTEPGVVDVVFAAFGRGEDPDAVGLVETDDRNHPRVRMRTPVPRSCVDPGLHASPRGRRRDGPWTGARGPLGRRLRGRSGGPLTGLGKRLVNVCAALAPEGEPVFLQCSPGNVASMRAIEASGGWRVVGSEVLFLRR